MITIIAGILMLGVLVFIHELGHFTVAKLCGVKVLKFSLGFGPKLVAKSFGETTYQVCIIPLGGYVQMLGEGSGEQGEDGEIEAEDEARSFAHKPVSKRLAIVAAGPLTNLIFPLLILPLAYLIGVQMPTYIDGPATVGYVIQDSVADQHGFIAGDQIVGINGEAINSWNDTNKRFVNEAGTALNFTLAREGELTEVTIPEDNSSLEGLQALGLLPQQAAKIGSLATGMPAEIAGMQYGDLILSIGGHEITSWYQLKGVIQEIGAQETEVVLERDGRILSVPLTPELRDEDDGYLLGIGPLTEVETQSYGFVDAVKLGVERTWELVELTVVFVQKLFTGSVSAKNIGGPITVVQVAGQAAQTGIAAILSVLAFISIQLGILNLLPIPILDGGHILFYLLELIFRRPVSFRVREIAQQVGMAMLLLLMLLAFYNDIFRIWG
jgi:regulator of sigma E protease